MLLFLHANIEVLPDDALRVYADQIGNLLDAHRQRRHLFLPTRQFARRLSHLSWLSEAQQRTASSIAQKHNDFAPLRNTLRYTFGLYLAGAGLGVVSQLMV